MQFGILLLNLGTPNDPSVRSVRKYLKQFLSDPRVIDLPAVIRKILLYSVILPFRSRSSSHAYKTIWQDEGSPLLINSINLKKKLQARIGDKYRVELGMTYGEPSIKSAIDKLDIDTLDKLIILPLFPQYASAATGSSLEGTYKILSKRINFCDVEVISNFYDDKNFIESLSCVTRNYLLDKSFDYILMSYHGLPERQVRMQENKPHCDMKLPCPTINTKNKYCYRAQCYATSRALAKELCLPDSMWGVSFQSRLGKIPWIQPYTDEYLSVLYKEGIRDLAVICPSFTADCLETIEEIGIAAKETWKELGGGEFHLVPCLNDSDIWVKSLLNIIIDDVVLQQHNQENILELASVK